MLSRTRALMFLSRTSVPVNAPCVLSNSNGRRACHILKSSEGGRGIMLGMDHMNAKDVVPGGRLMW